MQTNIFEYLFIFCMFILKSFTADEKKKTSEKMMSRKR